MDSSIAKKGAFRDGTILLTVKAFAVAVIDDDLLCLGSTRHGFDHDNRLGAR
jgi:hypothetical protein